MKDGMKPGILCRRSEICKCVIFNATLHFFDSISLAADVSQVTQSHLTHFCCVDLTSPNLIIPFDYNLLILVVDLDGI